MKSAEEYRERGTDRGSDDDEEKRSMHAVSIVWSRRSSALCFLGQQRVRPIKSVTMPRETTVELIVYDAPQQHRSGATSGEQKPE